MSNESRGWAAQRAVAQGSGWKGEESHSVIGTQVLVLGKE